MDRLLQQRFVLEFSCLWIRGIDCMGLCLVLGMDETPGYYQTMGPYVDEGCLFY
jgi:hypothetical protein